MKFAPPPVAAVRRPRGKAALGLAWLLAGAALVSPVAVVEAQPVAPGPLTASEAEAKGLAIARTARAGYEGFGSERSALVLEIVDARGQVTARRLTMEILDRVGDGDRTLIAVQQPADARGTKLLTWAHRQGDDDRWLYVPATGRTRRLPAATRAAAFMGSELSYEDIVGAEVEKFTYVYIGEPKLDGHDTWQIDRYPIERDSGYSKQTVWLDQDSLAPLRIDSYDRRRELVKVSIFGPYTQDGRFWRCQRVSVDNVQTRRRSVLTWESRQLGAGLSATRFDSARLED
jgi:hypothetical protein